MIHTCNQITIVLYLMASAYITLAVGQLCYKHGKPFLFDVFHHNLPITNSLNRILLTSYYLLNLGYVALTLTSWQHLPNMVGCIEQLFTRLGIIVLTLAIMHYFNLFICNRFANRIQVLYEN